MFSSVFEGDHLFIANNPIGHIIKIKIFPYVILYLNSKYQVIGMVLRSFQEYSNVKTVISLYTLYQKTVAGTLDFIELRKESISDKSVLAICTQAVAFMPHTGDGIYDQIL